MNQRLGLVTIVVRDYDEAINFFCQSLGFILVEDTAVTIDKRWVVVRPTAEDSSCLLLARAVNKVQQASIGMQAGGRVAFFLQTDDLDRDFRLYQSRGVEFLELPRQESYGKVAVFVDLCGNKWDLIQPKAD